MPFRRIEFNPPLVWNDMSKEPHDVALEFIQRNSLVGTVMRRGFYNLTPAEWTRNLFQHWFRVINANVGEYVAIPTSDESTIVDVQSGWRKVGKTAQRVLRESRPIVIAGSPEGDSAGQIWIYRYVYWTPR